MQPAAILQIVREPLKPGSDAEFSAIEEDRARVSVRLGCPHPYLGTESLTGSKEAWWFNAYESSSEQQQVAAAYAKNTALLAEYQRTAGPKARLTLEPIETFAHYRPDLSIGKPWVPGRGRFLVITVTKSDRRITGTVFEGSDGTRFIVAPAQTRAEADAVRAFAGPEATILAVRPSWSFPAKDWVDADSAFWQPHVPVKP
jgi:hypothetical protein